jgi:UPF0042 nucleotide-binding protein
MKLIVVTGLSGSGKSIALHTLEDLGYYCIDNLPIGMLKSLADEIQGLWGNNKQKFAVGIDARNTGLDDIPGLLKTLESKNISSQIVYLHSDQTVLLKRFNETRRKHPLTGESTSLLEALQLEEQVLQPLANEASIRIDTSNTNIHQLRDIIKEHFGDPNADQMTVVLQSFGFKHGSPADADFIFDVRCLPNPHWQTELRPLTGLDQEVVQFLEQHDDVETMLKDILDFLGRWIPHFDNSNRKYLNIAVGCTGGQHRSVYLISRLGAELTKIRENIIVRHRELT